MRLLVFANFGLVGASGLGLYKVGREIMLDNCSLWFLGADAG